MTKNYKTDDDYFPFSPNKHRKINPSLINNFTTTTTSSSEQEEQVVIVHLDFHFGSKLLTNYYRNISQFKLNSNILIQNNIFLLNEIIYHTKHNSQSIPPQLLYRGSRDGFNTIDFHSRCDNQGPTLTIIKSSEPNNQIFGGFTTQSWKSPPSKLYGKFVSDSSAFIFKIDNENKFLKFNIKQDDKQHAIIVHTNYLPVFGGGGGGNDICICSDCNLNNYSFSIFGRTYELPRTTTTDNNELFKFGSEEARNYLAGSYEFKVSEIEVFKITIQ